MSLPNREIHRGDHVRAKVIIKGIFLNKEIVAVSVAATEIKRL